MALALAQDIMAESFTDMNEALDKLVWKFRMRYGGEVDELRAEANLQFIYAHNKYNPESGLSYAGWVCFRVWKCLLERVRRSARQRARSKDVGMENEYDVPTRCDDIRNVILFDQFSENAKAIVDLLLDTPDDLQTLITKRGGSMANARTGVRTYVQKTLAWSKERAIETIKEIEVVING